MMSRRLWRMIMDRGLKLFVWHNVLRQYGPGKAFALAHSKEEAIAEIRKAMWMPNDQEMDELERAVEVNAEIREPYFSVHTSPVGFAVWGSS
jgi:hypothetical protein